MEAAAPAPPPAMPAPMPTMPAMLGGRAFDELCPGVVLLEDAGSGAAAPARATDVTVTFRATKQKVPASSGNPAKTDFLALIVAPALTFEHEIFRIGTEGDPFQCCSDANANGLDVMCEFSGVDMIESRATARVEHDELVVRWCEADLSTKTVVGRGEKRAPVRVGAHVRFAHPPRRCEPRW